MSGISSTVNLATAGNNTHLHDVTRTRLLQFQQRRSLLTILRGLAWAIVFAVATLLLTIVVDSLIPHASARWLGSLTFYTVTLGGLAFGCLRPVLRQRQLVDEARQLEQLDPRLRDHLLAAVELSQQSTRGDSPAFRSALQARVADMMSTVDPVQALPFSNLRQPLQTAGIAIAGLLLLCLIPQLHFGWRISRLLLPLADIGRVTSLLIQIEQPTPPEQTVPLGDIVAVRARLSSPFAGRVTLEMRTPTTHQHDQVMVAAELSPDSAVGQTSQSVVAASVFAGTLSTNEAWIEYRVHAEQARTSWYRLTTSQRPAVESYHKTIQLPGYALQSPIERTEKHGDLTTWIDSRVRMEFELNQADVVATITWLNGPTSGLDDQSQLLAFDDASGRAFVEFPVSQSGEYRVDLLSKTSGLKNDFSSTYRITALIDQPPKLSWLEPTTTSSVVGIGALVPMSLRVQDEWELSELSYRWRKRQGSVPGEWQMPQSIARAASAAAITVEDNANLNRVDSNNRYSHDFRWTLDLQAFQIAAGDGVEVQAIAVDRKGQVTESPLVQFIVSPASIDVPTTAGQFARSSVATSLEQLAEDFADSSQTMDALQQELNASRNPPTAENTPEQPQPRSMNEVARNIAEQSQQIAQQLRNESRQVHELIKGALAEQQQTIDEHELRGVGNIVSQFATAQSSDLQAAAEELLKQLAEDPMPVEGDASHAAQQQTRSAAVADKASQLLDKARQSLSQVRELASDSRAFASHDEVERRAMQFSNLARAQRELVAQSELLATAGDASVSDENGTVGVEPLARQAAVLAQQMQELQSELRQQADGTVRTATRERFAEVAREMNWLVEQAEQAGQSDNPERIAEVATALAQSLEGMQLVTRLDGSLPDAVRDGQRRLLERAMDAGDAVARLRQERERGAGGQTSREKALLGHLANERELQRSGSHADTQYGSDLGMLRRAASELQSTTDMTEEERTGALKDLNTAAAQLAAANVVDGAAELLAELQRAEQWNRDPSVARTEQPKIWRAYEQQLEAAVRSLRQSEVPRELSDRLEQLRWDAAAQRAGQKIGERYWRFDALVSAATDIRELAEQLREVQAEVATYADQARLQLQDTAPALSELAERAAEAAEQLNAETSQLAGEEQRGEVPDPAGRIAALEQTWNAENQPLDELQEALVDAADSQSLLDRSGLQQMQQVDQALDLANRAQRQVKQSLDQLVESASSAQANAAPSTTEPLSEQLNQSAEMQADAAAALRELAKHLDAPESDAELDAELYHEQRMAALSSIGQQLSAADNPQANADAAAREQAYAQADRLSRLAAADPAEALRQLERRLQASPPMQAELSDIARSAADQALETLEQAQAQQSELVGDVERSDPLVAAQQDLLKHDLRTATEAAEQVTQNLIDQAADAAQRGESDRAKQLSSLAQQLNQAREQVGDINQINRTQELREAATALSSTLKTGATELAQVEEGLKEIVPIHDNSADLNNRRQEMRDRQRRVQQQQVRANQQLERRTQQAAREVNDRLRRAQNQRKEQERSLQRTQNELKKNPDQQWLRDQSVRQKQELALADMNVQALEELRSSMDDRVKQAAEGTKQFNAQESSSLDSLNPSTELATNLSARAREQLNALADTLQQNWPNPPPSAAAANGELGEAIRAEEHIQHDTQNAADTLARASRHEQRLQNQAAATSLGQIAERAADVAESELPQASRDLSSAQQQASAEQATTGQASTAGTEAAMQSMLAAADALGSSAEQLRDLLQEASPQAAANSQQSGSQQSSSGSQASSQASSQQSASNGGNAVLPPRELAQLLDELDRQLSQRSSDSASQSANSQANNSRAQNAQASNAGQAGQPIPQTLLEAARRLAAGLSQSRQSNSPASESSQASMQSNMANTNPQPPTSARVVQVDRIGEDWGNLREQGADEVIQSRRDNLPPHIRRQVEAYFRSLSE